MKKQKRDLFALKKAGLTELNLSTGDDHQEFVPFDNIVNAVVAGAQLQISTLISVETTASSKFSSDDIRNHPRYISEIVETGLNQYVKIVKGVWVSFHSDHQYEYAEEETVRRSKSCNTLFDSICIGPDRTIMGCCGLCVEHIPELSLGKFIGNNLLETYESQKRDFIKIWLYVEGAQAILDQVREWNPMIEVPEFHHMCQACACIYQNEEIQETIRVHYKERYNEICDRFIAMQILNGTEKD